MANFPDLSIKPRPTMTKGALLQRLCVIREDAWWVDGNTTAICMALQGLIEDLEDVTLVDQTVQ